jgi:serine/threonine protein kinase
LKLDNILVRIANGKPHLLISDFGFATKKAKEAPDFAANSYKGTKKGYMAPEIHKLLETPQSYDPFKVDIFALGVVLFSLLFNRLPFEYAVSSDKYYQLIESKEYNLFWARHKISEDTYPKIPLLQGLK